MTRTITGAILLIMPFTGQGQTGPLSEILWSRVKPCLSMFEDVNDDGIPDFDKVDDSRNGYLSISGGWPTCGCSCSSTVGAYKDDQGNYTILQSDQASCSWERTISSNRSLKDILPEGFGVSSFSSGEILTTSTGARFFVDFEIPRIGTDTKVKIELVPFGLKPEGDELICYEYKQSIDRNKPVSLSRLKDIAEDIQNTETLDLLLAGDLNSISSADNKVILKAIGNDDSRFKSRDELRKALAELKETFDIYKRLDVSELILGWDKGRSKFYIKEKRTAGKYITFRDFLTNGEYWSPTC